MTQECTIKKILDRLSELLSQLDAKPGLSELQSPSNKANNEQPSERPIEEKRPSWWARLCVRERGKKVGQVTNEASNHASDSGGSQGGSSRGRGNVGEDQVAADLEILKLNIRQMKAAFENLEQFETSISTSLERGLPSKKKLNAILQKTDSINFRSQNLKEIRGKILNLKSMIPLLLYKESSRGLSITDSQTAEENGQIDETGSNIFLPGLHVSIDIKDSSAFKEVVEKFQGLEFNKKLCLLSFAVFPENKEVKRTMLMYWWIGEGFICYENSENSVTGILDYFSRNGLLEPVEDERKLNPSSYKMEPLVHSAVIYLARSVGIFDLYTSEETSKGKLTMKKSEYKMVCLVRGSSLQRQAKTSVMEPKNLNSVFNSSERYPDFTFKWFPGMESLRVLYLGRWERTATRHIEVESTEFLKHMKHLKNLRLASFQGISRIEKLENPICALPNLVILDLRACYNLEVLPDDIGSLDNLIFLDVSECYMLDRMPKGIEDLRKLQVLKGFVISESDDEKNCAVKQLVDLRKLSITVNKYLFEVTKLMESLKGLKRLESLKIAWGARFSDEDRRGEKIEDTDEAKGNEETTNEEKQKQRAHATEEKQKEREDDQVHKKGQTSEEKKEDGRNEKANLEGGKKHDEVKSEKTASASREETWTIQNKPADQKGKSKVEGDGDKGKANLEQGKEQDEVETEKSKSDNGVEGVNKAASPSRESAEMNQKNPDDKSNVEKEKNGDKGKADLEEGKKQDEVDAEKSKSDNGVEGIKKAASPSRESSEMNQKNPDDKSKVEKEENGDRGKADLEEGKKQDEVDAEKLKPDNGVEGIKKASPSRESSEMNQKNPDDKSKVEKEENGDRGKADLEDGKKQDEVDAEKSKSDNGVEGVKKEGPSPEGPETIQNKPDDHQKGDKQEEERGGEKEKGNLEEGKKKYGVKEESSKPDKVFEEDEKTNPPQESKDTAKSKPDDHQRGDKQEDKGGGEKEKVNLEEGKKKDELKTESSKPDKVIEKDEKTSPPQESKDTIQSKPNDHKENSKFQEEGDGENIKAALKTPKSNKNKLGKKVSFSEELRAPIQKKPDDLKKDNAMSKEIHETSSPSRPKKTAPKESGSSKAKPFSLKRNETKKLGKRGQEDSTTDELPSSLKKLELECFPNKEPPIWLNPKNLDNLEKLSIKGGNLSRIELPTAKNNCRIQILRLKYLHEFKAEWKDLQAQFPQLKLLEKYQCPKVAFCPTDGKGVWRSQDPQPIDITK